MSNPWDDRIDKYLCCIKEIRKSFKTYDIHIHPIEIFFNFLDYQEDLALKGLFRFGERTYKQPSLEELGKLKPSLEKHPLIHERSQITRMFFRSVYFHTGPRVFREYFDILGIDRGLLLPVAPEIGPIDQQMDLLNAMFNGETRFCMAGCVPNTIMNQQVYSFMKQQKEKHRVVATKIHPNITGINLNTSEGKERVECIIEASSNLGLPVIIHGGRSHFLKNDNGRFADISNLKDIDFNSSTPIIIAHGGTYGLSASEVMKEAIPVLKSLLCLYPNLNIDIAGLDHDTINRLLTCVEPERVLFGSDALYENQILMLVRFLYALESSGLNFEDSLIQILCENAANRIFVEDQIGKEN